MLINIPIFAIIMKANATHDAATGKTGQSLPVRFFLLYRDGLRNMTWGRQLWALVAIKLFVIFVVLRLLFFTPYYGGKSDVQKSQAVATELIRQGSPAH